MYHEYINGCGLRFPFSLLFCVGSQVKDKIYHCSGCGNFYHEFYLNAVFDYCVQYEHWNKEEFCHVLPWPWSGDGGSGREIAVKCGGLIEVNGLNKLQIIKLKRGFCSYSPIQDGGYMHKFLIKKVNVNDIPLMVAGIEDKNKVYIGNEFFS